MAKLYEINEAIEACVDRETGEIIDPEKLKELAMARDKKIEGVALWLKNLQADAEAFKKEKEAFAERERVAKNKVEGLKNYLTFALQGKKFSTEKVEVRFTRSAGVDFDNEQRFVELCMENGRDDLLTYKEPTPNKKAIKELLKQYPAYYGAHMEERINAQIK